MLGSWWTVSLTILHSLAMGLLRRRSSNMPDWSKDQLRGRSCCCFSERKMQQKRHKGAFDWRILLLAGNDPSGWGGQIPQSSHPSQIKGLVLSCCLCFILCELPVKTPPPPILNSLRSFALKGWRRSRICDCWLMSKVFCPSVCLTVNWMWRQQHFHIVPTKNTVFMCPPPKKNNEWCFIWQNHCPVKHWLAVSRCWIFYFSKDKNNLGLFFFSFFFKQRHVKAPPIALALYVTRADFFIWEKVWTKLETA